MTAGESFGFILRANRFQPEVTAVISDSESLAQRKIPTERTTCWNPDILIENRFGVWYLVACGSHSRNSMGIQPPNFWRAVSLGGRRRSGFHNRRLGWKSLQQYRPRKFPHLSSGGRPCDFICLRKLIFQFTQQVRGPSESHRTTTVLLSRWASRSPRRNRKLRWSSRECVSFFQRAPSSRAARGTSRTSLLESLHQKAGEI